MHQTKPSKASEILLPLPKNLEDRDGIFRLHKTTSIAADPMFSHVANLAVSMLGCKHGGEDILFKYQGGLAGEEYLLSVAKSQIVIKASTEEGIFRGLSTLRRLDLASNHLIPCLRCQDKPTYVWRGFMLDCSRHFFTTAFIKKLLDAASLFHLNRFHWHLSDDQGWRIPIDGYEKLISVGSKHTERQYTEQSIYEGHYTKEAIQEIQDYAHQRYIQVIPEIETPGHVSALLASYPQLGCTTGPYTVEDRWGIFEEVLCAGNDEVLSVLNTIISQTASLFTDPYIHIGGDECPHVRWESCPRCQKRVQELGIAEPKELQGWLTSKICTMVHENGKRPIGWDEVLQGAQKFGLPKDLIIMSWRGKVGGDEALELGHEVIMSPNTEGCYFDYKHVDSAEEMGNIGVSTLEQVASFTPGSDANILGSQGNLWTEKVLSSRQAEYLLFPRLPILAERLWNPQEDPDSVNRRLPFLLEICSALDILHYTPKRL